MSFLKYPTVQTLLSLLLAISLQAQSPADKSLGQRRRELAERRAAQGIKIHDDPAGRMQWVLEWFGGMPSVEHLRQKAELAQLEFTRWESQFPGSTRLPAASIPGSTSAWRNLGPTANLTTGSHPDIDSGLPGGVVADPTDPKILYVGSSGGGVYRTTNADQTTWTWTNITDSLALTSANGSIATGALAMDPTDHNVLYFGLGDSDSSYAASGDAAGVGLYKTSNASGATPAWTLCGALGNTTHTRCILVLDANNVLVGGNDGLWRSTNGGTSFSRVTTGSGLLAGRDVWTVAKLDASNLIASAQTSAGAGSIWYSTNGGADWTAADTSAIPGLHRVSIATAPLDPTFGATNALGVYENGSGNIARGLLKSTDKGHIWTFTAAPTISGGLFQGIGGSMSTDGSQGFYNHGLTVDPTNISNVFLGANMALYRTTDGGANWTQLTHWYGDRHVYAHADWHKAAWYGAGTVNARLYYGNDGGLCVVKDPFRSSVPTGAGAVAADTTFIDNTHNLNLATHLIYNIGSTNTATPADAKFRITLGLQDNGTRVRQPATPGGTITGNDTVFEDKNGGDGFGTLISQANGDLMLASYVNCQISKSTNGGNDNFPISATGITEAGGSGAPFVTRLALGDTAHPNTVYTFVNTKVYKSTDFGSSFTAMGASGLTPGTIRNINASRSDSNSVAVVSSGGAGFITANGGATWVAFGAFPGGAASMSYVWFDTNTPATLYAASVAQNFSANHLWKSSNSGGTWTAIDGGGFPFGVAVHVIQNDPADSTVLLAGTDFGVYRSSDSGSNWVRYGQNMPFVAVRDLYIAPDGSFIRAGTYGRGVWEVGSVITPVAVVTTPSTAIVPAGSSQVFSATVSFSTTNNTVNWTVSPVSGGTFSPTNTASGVNTTFTAGATPGPYTVRATSVEDGIRFGESALTVTTACTPTSVLTQNFDTVTAPALPAGWTPTTALGTLAPWATTTLGSDTAPNAVFTPSSTSPSDNRLDSPAFSIAAGTVFAQASFKHAYDFEPGFDGGVLEISINGGAFTDILVAGGSFVSGGYTTVLGNNASANPLAGRSAWSGTQSTAGTVIVNLPSAIFGQSNNKLRWRAGSDVGTAGTGWTVDTINISACLPGAAVATHFLVTAYPNSTGAGAAHTFTVTAQDAGNATVTTYAGTVHITSSDAAAVLPSNATLVSGVGTFSLTMNTVGSQSITATDTVTASITGSQAGIVVNPGAAATIATTSGTPQSALISTAFATALTATVRDGSSNPVPGVSVTFAAPGAGASGTFGGSATVTTNASGVATAPTFTANATAGSYTVTATAAGVVTPANFSLTNNPAPVITINVSPTTATILTSGTVVLNGTVSSGSITWATSGGALNIATGPSVTFTPATTGIFMVTATAVADTSKTATATINVKSKDQDANGIVDVLDLAYFARYYGTSNFAADLNGDGIVDDLDITIFLTGF